MGSEDSFHIVLHRPVIPQNTGSIARLCACTGATLHLIHPLGFEITESAVRRAGLDYWPHVTIREHASWEAFLEAEQPEEMHLFEPIGSKVIYDVPFGPKPYLVFGGEVKGIPQEILDRFPEKLVRVPMRTTLVRSLNLSQSVSVAVYEAMRQRNAYPL